MNNGRPVKLLVSVRDEREARDALAGGADWIDLKEPSAGALGAVDAMVAERVINAVAGLCRISAALGELSDWIEAPASALLELPGIQVVKLGLAGCGSHSNWQRLWHEALKNCAQHDKQLAAVIYADWIEAHAPHPEELLTFASGVGGNYLLIDTFHKNGLSSTDSLGKSEMARLLHVARQRGLTTVLAGSLRVDDLPDLISLPVDVIAIRGAACRGGRDAQLDTRLVREFRTRLDANGRAKYSNSRLTTFS